MDDVTSHARPRVLVVEDNAGVSRMLRLLLSSVGFEVTEAAIGKEALQELDAGPVDGVILDPSLSDALVEQSWSVFEHGKRRTRARPYGWSYRLSTKPRWQTGTDRSGVISWPSLLIPGSWSEC